MGKIPQLPPVESNCIAKYECSIGTSIKLVPINK